MLFVASTTAEQDSAWTCLSFLSKFNGLYRKLNVHPVRRDLRRLWGLNLPSVLTGGSSGGRDQREMDIWSDSRNPDEPQFVLWNERNPRKRVFFQGKNRQWFCCFLINFTETKMERWVCAVFWPQSPQANTTDTAHPSPNTSVSFRDFTFKEQTSPEELLDGAGWDKSNDSQLWGRGQWFVPKEAGGIRATSNFFDVIHRFKKKKNTKSLHWYKLFHYRIIII